MTDTLQERVRLTGLGKKNTKEDLEQAKERVKSAQTFYEASCLAHQEAVDDLVRESGGFEV